MWAPNWTLVRIGSDWVAPVPIKLDVVAVRLKKHLKTQRELKVTFDPNLVLIGQNWSTAERKYHIRDRKDNSHIFGVVFRKVINIFHGDYSSPC